MRREERGAGTRNAVLPHALHDFQGAALRFGGVSSLLSTNSLQEVGREKREKGQRKKGEVEGGGLSAVGSFPEKPKAKSKPSDLFIEHSRKRKLRLREGVCVAQDHMRSRCPTFYSQEEAAWLSSLS